MFGLSRLSRTWVVCFAVAVAAGPLRAQPDADAPAPKDHLSPAASDKRVEQIGPTILFLRDEEGRLQPSPDLGLEELNELDRLRKAQQEAEPAPRFHFEEAVMTGAADAEKATFELNYKVVVHEAGWVRVPLELGGAVISRTEFAGDGSHFIEYDAAQRGYFAWLKSAAVDAQHEIHLTVLTRLTTVGNETRLELRLPRVVATRAAPTMTLRVATPKAVGMAGGGAEVEETKHQGNTTEFRIGHPGGDFTFAWRSAAQTARPAPVVFDARSQIIAYWEDQSRLSWSATISLQVAQGELSSVQVALPPAARAAEQVIEGASIVDSQTEGSGKNEHQVVTLRFDRPIAEKESREMRLRCERVIDRRQSAAAPIELAGFRVLNAARQSGYFGIAAAPGWRATVVHTTKVFPQREMPEGFREAGVLGSDTYEFLSPTFSIQVSLAARERKVTAEPIYVLRVGQGKLSLQAHLRYRPIGASPDVYTALFPGWEIEKVELLEGGENENLDFDPPTESTLHMNLPRKVHGELELRVTAAQAMPTDAASFVVNLPTVLDADELVGPALIVQPADNIEMTFDGQASSGIAPGEGQLPLEIPAGQRPTQYFRVTEEDVATFAADFNVRTREISAVSQARIHVERASLDVRQELTYDVRFEPLASVLLELSPALAANASLRFTLEGEPLPPNAWRRETTDGAATLLVALPEPMIGAFKIGMSYAMAAAEPALGESIRLPVALATPSTPGVKLLSSAASVTASPQIKIVPSAEDWELLAVADSASEEGLSLSSQVYRDRLDLLATYVEKRGPRSTVVERAWVQTWLTNRERQDRAVYQLRTNADSLSVNLPETAAGGELLVLLDGVALAVADDAARRVNVPLTMRDDRDEAAMPRDAYRRHVLEIGWRSDYQAGLWRTVQLNAPVVENAWTQQVRWQILTPRQQMLPLTPAGMEAEMTSSLWWWQRRPLLDQDDLERWSGATAQPSPESTDHFAAQRQYVFSSVGQPGGARTTIVSAAMAMLILGGLTLGALAAFVYWPRMRHPMVLLAAGMLVAYLAFRWPSAALLAGQAAGMALFVALAARLLERLLLRRRGAPQRSRSVAASTGAPERPSTRVRTDSGSVRSPSTTSKAAAPLPFAPSEVK